MPCSCSRNVVSVRRAKSARGMFSTGMKAALGAGEVCGGGGGGVTPGEVSPPQATARPRASGRASPLPGNKPGPGPRRWSPGRRLRCPSPRGSPGDAGHAPAGDMPVSHRCHPLAPISPLPPAAHGLPASPQHRPARHPWDEAWPGSISGTKASRFWGHMHETGRMGAQGRTGKPSSAASDRGSVDRDPPTPGDAIAALGAFSIVTPDRSGFSRDGEFGAGCPPKPNVSPFFTCLQQQEKNRHPGHPTNPHPRCWRPFCHARGSHPVPRPFFGDNSFMP